MALEKERENIYNAEGSYLPEQDDIINEWKETGMCVIVLECKNTEQLLSAEKYLNQWGVTNHLYIDEGHTEVDALTPTALATGIMDENTPWMFSQYKLFKG